MGHRPARPAASSLPRLARGALLSLVVAGGVLPAAGCARRGAKSAQQDSAPTTVRVRNQGFLDVNVYVVRGGQRVRLGTVTGNSTQVLRIPEFLLSGATPLRFLADPIGTQRQPVSDEIVVTPGDEVTLFIPPG
jgi:hypothetical protein